MSHKGGATTACQRRPGAPRDRGRGALGPSPGTPAHRPGPGPWGRARAPPALATLANAGEGPEEGLAKAHEVGGPIATVPWR